MKYKNINSMIHNFVHSFLSYMNYFDGGYIVDDVLERARTLKKDEKLLIQFFPNDPEYDVGFSERVRKSIAFYRERFSKHCQSHKVNPEAIVLFQASLVKTSSHQILAHAVAIDDKGKRYEEYVSF